MIRSALLDAGAQASPDTAQDTLQWLRRIWEFPVATVADQGIRVGNVILAIVFLIVAVVVARTLSRRLVRHLLQRLGVHEGSVYAFQSLSFYLLLFFLSVFSLHLASIPVTMFAVLGGAIAIGLGFGSQTLVGDFISGLVLLVERPIRMGDLVEIDGTLGTVEKIGLRSTWIRSVDNISIVLPNASVAGGKIINWTLSDIRVRSRLSVGVAYGSPTREVERLLMRAVGEHPKVLKDPAPVALFKDFGDNALQFELLFWVEMDQPLARLRIESEIRFRVDELFREHRVVIAFPQRDIHVDTLRPLEIRMLAPDAAPGSQK